MKSIFQLTILAGIVVIFLLSGCGQESKDHLNEANENLKEANQNLKEASQDADAEVKARARADWQAFKNESDSSIAAMEKQAVELKGKIVKADKKTKAKLSSDLESLEQKLNEQKAKLNQANVEFESDLDNFNDTIVAKNQLFRKEFKHDMNGLGNAFNDLFEDNVK